jgi:hypothetical protein
VKRYRDAVLLRPPIFWVAKRLSIVMITWIDGWMDGCTLRFAELIHDRYTLGNDRRLSSC